jgi:hypothetical protein
VDWAAQVEPVSVAMDTLNLPQSGENSSHLRKHSQFFWNIAGHFQESVGIRVAESMRVITDVRICLV